MAFVYEDVELVAARVTLLLVVCLFGIPGNIVAIVLNKRNLTNNSVNSVAFLHLAVVDSFICIFHSSSALLLEGVGYYSRYSDLGTWRPFLTVLASDIGLRMYFIAQFISPWAVTLIAALRCWRMFNPFGVLRKGFVFGVIVLFDIMAVVFGVLFQSTRTKPAAQKIGDFNNTSVADNFTGNVGMMSANHSQIYNDNATLGTISDNTRGTTQMPVLNFAVQLIRYGLLISIAATIVFYLIICCKIGFQQNALFKDNKVGKKDFLARQKKNLITQILLFSVLMLSVLPSILQGFFDNNGFAFKRFMVTVSTLNSVVNPYIYCLLTPAIRKKLRQLKRRTTLKENSTVDTVTS